MPVNPPNKEHCSLGPNNFTQEPLVRGGPATDASSFSSRQPPLNTVIYADIRSFKFTLSMTSSF